MRPASDPGPGGTLYGVRVVIAPDKFAGTLTAVEAAHAVAEGWRSVEPGAELDLSPLSDGGPGFADVLAEAASGTGRMLTLTVTGPLGAPAEGRILRLGDTAYVESAQACGLHLVPPESRNALRATTYGVGELIRAAIADGAREIIIGLGGSANTDAGAGLLAALGATAQAGSAAGPAPGDGGADGNSAARPDRTGVPADASPAGPADGLAPGDAGVDGDSAAERDRTNVPQDASSAGSAGAGPGPVGPASASPAQEGAASAAGAPAGAGRAPVSPASAGAARGGAASAAPAPAGAASDPGPAGSASGALGGAAGSCASRVGRSEAGGAGLLAAGGGALPRIARVDVEPARRAVAGVTLIAASDVDNPLCGLNGAAAVFGPQKGADRAQVLALDDALGGFARLVAPELAEMPGAGAAGGLGFGIFALGGRRESGIGAVLDAVGLDARTAGADLVLTGEGAFDHQSLRGKVPHGVAQAAAAHGVPCVVLAGRVAVGRREMAAAGITEAYALVDPPGSEEKAFADPYAELSRLAARVARRWTRGR